MTRSSPTVQIGPYRDPNLRCPLIQYFLKRNRIHGQSPPPFFSGQQLHQVKRQRKTHRPSSLIDLLVTNSTVAVNADIRKQVLLGFKQGKPSQLDDDAMLVLGAKPTTNRLNGKAISHRPQCISYQHDSLNLHLA